MDRYFNANAVISKFCRDYMDLKKDLPIRPSEMGVLNIISRDDKKYTPVMIAELLGVSKPMVASHISVLEEKGYIKKESLTDKRSFYIIPTKKAYVLVENVREKINEELMKIEKKIGTEKFDLLVSITEEVGLYLESYD